MNVFISKLLLIVLNSNLNYRFFFIPKLHVLFRSYQSISNCVQVFLNSHILSEVHKTHIVTEYVSI